MNSSKSEPQAKPYAGPMHAHYLTAIVRDEEQPSSC